MNNNKQSSVEWLIKQKEKYGMIIMDDLIKAKAMHKEEMIQSCSKMQIINDVDFDGNVTFIFDPEQYYEQNYESRLD